MNIDFSPLTSSPAFSQWVQWASIKGKKHSVFTILFALGFVGLIVAIAIVPFFTFFWWGAVGVLTAFITWIVIKIIRDASKNALQKSEKDQALTTFLSRNQLQLEELIKPGVFYSYEQSHQYRKDISLPYNAVVAGTETRISGDVGGCAFEYLYTSLFAIDANGRESEAGVNAAVLRVKLPLSLPKLFIDSKFNNFVLFGFRPTTFTSSQNYTLEGGFSDSYKVTAEANDQINVLSLLSPDVMAILLDNIHFDVWISEDSLVLVRPTPASQIDYFGSIPHALKTAELLLAGVDKIARQLRQS